MLFVRVKPETLEILKKWGADVDMLAQAADAFMKNLNQVPIPRSLSVDEFESQRTRISEHKKKLIDFFTMRPSPAPRQLILGMTGIPPGSLSTVLREPEFAQTEHGMWTLRSLLPFGGKSPEELAKELAESKKKRPN
jgi:hypothetical protein